MFKNLKGKVSHGDNFETNPQLPVEPRRPRSRKDSLTRTAEVSRRTPRRGPPVPPKNDADRLSAVHRPFSFVDDEPQQEPHDVRVARFSPRPRGFGGEAVPESPPADLQRGTPSGSRGSDDELFLAPRPPALQRRASSRLPSYEDDPSSDPPAHLRLDNVGRGRPVAHSPEWAEGASPRSVHVRFEDAAAPTRSFASRADQYSQRPEDRKLSRSRTFGHWKASR